MLNRLEAGGTAERWWNVCNTPPRCALRASDSPTVAVAKYFWRYKVALFDKSVAVIELLGELGNRFVFAAAETRGGR